MVQRRLFIIWLLFAPTALAEAYKPIFSDAMLEQASPEARSRLEALEAENRTRWEAENAGKAQPPKANGSQAKPSSPNQLYRYTDANGITHFSRNPPAGVNATPVEVSDTGPSAEAVEARRAAVASEQAALADFEERRRVQARIDAERAAERRDQRKRADECRALFNDIEDYRKGGVIYYDVNDAGERVYWSDARLQQEIVALEAEYSEHCGSLDRARGR